MTDGAAPIRIHLGRRWYRPSYDEVVARENAERAARDGHEYRVVLRVTAWYWCDALPPDLVVAAVAVASCSGVLDLLRVVREAHARARWSASRGERRRLGIVDLSRVVGEPVNYLMGRP